MKHLQRTLVWLFGWLPIATAAFAQGTNGTPSTVVSSDANDQLVYFTSTSLLADDRRIVFLSDRSGQPNIWLRDTGTGRDKQLTFNTEAFLKSYVYFEGVPYRGIGRASVSVNAQRGIIYFIQGRHICSVDTQGVQRVLAEYPTNQMTAFTHVSADGTKLCVPTTDARVLDGDKQLKGRPGYDIDARVQREHLVSYLRVYDTASGRQIVCEPVTNAWITHVQFSPRDDRLVLYNHEYCAESGIRRMWLWDGTRHVRLRAEGEGRQRNDWTCHEMWERDGSAIIYHGSYTNGPAYIGRVKPDGTGTEEVALPIAWNRYGHFTVGNPGELATDGCYVIPDDPKRFGGNWISVVRIDWATRKYNWQPLCRHDSSWTSQDSHPHPIFNHAANAIYFTSDAGGKRRISRVEYPPAKPPQ